MIIKEVKKLREKVTENWSFVKPPKDTKEFAEELIEAMWKNSGLGISANQLGYNYRVFAMRGETKKDSVVCFNPEIKDFSPEMNTMEEGCLSFSLSQVDNKFIIYETFKSRKDLETHTSRSYAKTFKEKLNTMNISSKVQILNSIN